MQYAEKNGIKISKMTLGTVQLGLKYGVNNSSGMPTEKESFDILDAAYSGGVTALDTSDDYGKSEEVIGNYLKKNQDKHFDICTKFKITEESSKDIYKSLKEFAERSLKKLSIDKIPFFLSHTEANFIDYGDKLVQVLNELKKEGIIQKAGISVSNKDCLNRLIESGGFDAVQLPLNLLDNKELRDGTVKKMADAGITVFVRSVYLQGLFFRKQEELLNSNLSVAAPLVKKIHEIAENEGLSVSELAMSFIRDSEGVDSLVVGSETPEQVKENLKMFETPTLSLKVREKILDEFSNVDSFVISPWEWNRRK